MVWTDKIVEEVRDTFKLSNGNKKVLETIPSMMEDEEYRNKLRSLTLDFIQDKIIGGKKDGDTKIQKE